MSAGVSDSHAILNRHFKLRSSIGSQDYHPDHDLLLLSFAMSRPMNDDEVLSEMKKMVSFIKQEAMEKAREIQVKADEEFAIEKVS